MTALTEAGDAAVAVPFSIAVLVWLLWRRAWRDAKYWLAALCFAMLAVAAIKLAVHMPRPVDLYTGAEAYSFPSSHSTLTTVIYGFLAVLTAPSFPSRWRWVPYGIAAILITGIAFSRLYLGAHWLADVAAGLGLGTAWIALLAIARARHSNSHAAISGLPQVAAVAFAGATAWHVHSQFDSDLERYAVKMPGQMMAELQWWNSGWQNLPAYRVDMEGEAEQPLNIQWAGDLHVLENTLESKGWRRPQDLTLHTAMRLLLPNPSIGELPVLPQFHDGRAEALVLVHGGEPQDQQLVLRLWPSGARLRESGARLWVGTIAQESIGHLPLLSFPRNAGNYDEALMQLKPGLVNPRSRIAQRLPNAGEDGRHWNGETLIAAPSQ